MTGQAEKEANSLIFCRTFHLESFYFKANYFRTFNFRAQALELSDQLLSTHGKALRSLSAQGWQVNASVGKQAST